MELRIYTIDEAAEALKLNKFTLYRYIKSGKLKGAKIGRDWRFTEEQLKDFLKSMTPSASTSENLSGGQDVRSE